MDTNMQTIGSSGFDDTALDRAHTTGLAVLGGSLAPGWALAIRRHYLPAVVGVLASAREIEEPQTQTADHIAALAVASEDDGRELTLTEVLQAGFKRFGYVHPAEAAREACETIAAGPLPRLAKGQSESRS